MSGAFFRGTNLAQDQRFGDATQKLLSQTTFSNVLKKRVDMSKVNMEIIKPWISHKISELLGIEDEVLFEYVVNMLQESNTPDGKAMQVNLTGFLESKSMEFMQSLWTILLEAQKGPGGVPESLVRGKVEEIRQQRVEQEKIRDRIRSADERVREEPRSERKSRSGRKSRWDAPALDVPDAERTVESRDRRDRDGEVRDSDRRRSRERRDSRDRRHTRERRHSGERRYSRERKGSRERRHNRDYRNESDRRHSRERSASPSRSRTRR